MFSSLPEAALVLTVAFVQQFGVSSALHTAVSPLLMSPAEAEARGQQNRPRGGERGPISDGAGETSAEGLLEELVPSAPDAQLFVTLGVPWVQGWALAFLS